jgi:hypothetical protein
VAHEPGDPVIWVISTPWWFDLPDQLHRIELDGARTWSAALEHDGGLIRAHALTTHAGQQFVGGRLNSMLVLQSRDQDQVTWTRTGYAGVSPDVGGAAQNSLRGLVWSDAGLSFIAYKSWLDSSTVSLFTVDDQDGEPTSVTLLAKDDFSGPSFALSSDREQRVYVSEERSAYMLDPARSIVTAYVNGDNELWRRETEWAGLGDLQTSAIITAAGRLHGVVSGYERSGAQARRVHIASYRLDGEFECSEELDELRGWTAGELSLAGDAKMILAASKPPEGDTAQWEQALVVFDANN